MLRNTISKAIHDAIATNNTNKKSLCFKLLRLINNIKFDHSKTHLEIDNHIGKSINADAGEAGITYENLFKEVNRIIVNNEVSEIENLFKRYDTTIYNELQMSMYYSTIFIQLLCKIQELEAMLIKAVNDTLTDEIDFENVYTTIVSYDSIMFNSKSAYARYTMLVTN